MAYERQVQEHLNRFDVSLNKLYMLIKRGENGEAIHYMEQGDLKERFEELQNIIIIASTNTLGARGTNQTGTF